MNAGTRLTKAGAFDHITTLDQVVASYRERFAHLADGRGHNDPVLPYCKEAPNLSVAIKRACAGRRPDGKMFSKGSCVRTSSREELAGKLLAVRRSLSEAETFDEVFDIVKGREVYGIGPMMIYNVAERIGAYLGHEPRDFVYLHAGPLEGWRSLTGYRGGATRVRREDLPAPLRGLSVYDIEDIFCEYRLVLKRSML